MGVFIRIWLGQVCSLVGSKLAEFAMGVWILQETESISRFGIAIVLIYLPNVFFSPIAGPIIDRLNRRYVMIAADTVSALLTVVFALLIWTDQLAVWHLYVGVAVRSAAEAFQVPAYTAAIAQLVSMDKLSRANGMVQISRGLGRLAAPLLAGYLVGSVGLLGVLYVDMTTFLIALCTLFSVRIPRVKAELELLVADQQQGWRRFLQEITIGWQQIVQRPGLVRLLVFMIVVYFTLSSLEVLLWPLVLDNSSEQILGLVLFIGGCGALLGSVLISTWGGPTAKIYGVLIPVFAIGSLVTACGLRFSLPLVAFTAFGVLFALPIIVSCNQAIWQRKIPQAAQGRVFALQQMLERSLSILAYGLSGPVIDWGLKPLMGSSLPLVDVIASVLGTDSETGLAIGAFLVAMGLINVLAGIVAWGQPQLRFVEKLTPDPVSEMQQPELSAIAK
ncbi:MAG: MFS transporter [Cyanobacteria bacterium P01_H01_bin.15]